MTELNLLFKLTSDREGRPVFFFIVKRFSPKDINPERFSLYLATLINMFLKEGSPLTDNYIMIYDMKNAGKQNLDLDFVKKLGPVMGSYFPESLFRMFLVRAGFLIKSMYGASKGLMPPSVQQKVKIN